MSLIETAVGKAKKLAETGVHRALKLTEPEPEPRRPSGRSHPDAAQVAERVRQARVLPLASVDPASMERAGVLLQVTDPVAQRSYRILRTRVQQRMLAHGWHSLAVTATGAGEGKTLTSLNLAISLARDINTWVYLVDFDLQRPKIATYLGLQFGRGLSDYLAGDAEFDQILYSPGVDRLGVIPNAQSIESSSDVLGSPRIRELCESLSNERPQPIVIYDLPPLLVSDDVIKFAPSADATLLVVCEGATSRASVQRAQEVLQDMNLIGVVLNRSSEREDSAYY